MLLTMKKPLIVAAAVFALVIGLLAWWFSDTQVIKRRTTELTEIFTIKADDGKASRISKNQNLGELLDRTFSCTIDLENYNGGHRRDDLIAAHLYLGQVCESSAVRVGAINITGQTNNSATVEAEFSVSVRMKGGKSYSESAPAALVWSKNENGQWRLSEVTLKSP